MHVHPRPEWLVWLDWPQPSPGVLRVRTAGETRRRIREALEAADTFGRSELRQATMFAVNAVEAALLWCTTSDPGAGLLDPRVLAAMEDMAGRLTEPITVADLARRAGLSPSRFAHLFTAQAGTSPMRYLERQRMRLAEQLLDLTPRTVTEVARTVGFDDPLYFSSRFRSYAGRSPTAYRRRGPMSRLDQRCGSTRVFGPAPPQLRPASRSGTSARPMTSPTTGVGSTPPAYARSASARAGEADRMPTTVTSASTSSRVSITLGVSASPISDSRPPGRTRERAVAGTVGVGGGVDHAVVRGRRQTRHGVGGEGVACAQPAGQGQPVGTQPADGDLGAGVDGEQRGEQSDGAVAHDQQPAAGTGAGSPDGAQRVRPGSTRAAAVVLTASGT